MTEPLLEVRGLSVDVATPTGSAPVVRDLSYALGPGESLGLVGESGCGKSLSALALVGLLPAACRVVAGEVLLRGTAGVRASAPIELTRDDPGGLRGRGLGMVFQDPESALNPVLTVGRQIAEVLAAHDVVERSEIPGEVLRLLTRVGIADPEVRARSHPHSLSGGQRQRVMIAMALAARPDVLVADEPTAALDVTVQARIVDLVGELREQTGMAVLWITHDLALAAGAVDRVAVMYAGRFVEEAPVRAIFRGPRHPYTRALVAATREMVGRAPGRRLTTIPGAPATLVERSRDACAYAPRCPRATLRCRERRPVLEAKGSSRHRVACWHPHDAPGEAEAE